MGNRTAIAIFLGLFLGGSLRASFVTDCLDPILYFGNPPSKLRLGVPTLAVVDGISSGADYGPRMKELFPKANLIHIQSNRNIPAKFYRAFGFAPSNYQLSLVHDGSPRGFRRLEWLLRPFKEDGLFLVVGSEPGVVFYDQLACALGLPQNNPLLSPLRRDKELMAESVAKHLRTIPGKSFARLGDALPWIREQSFRFPMFVKPSSSSGSFGGTIVRSLSELQDAFHKYVGRRDPMGGMIERLLIQKYVWHPKIEEYAVNVIVDREAGVVLTDLHRYRKKEKNGHVAYEASQLIRFDPSNLIHQKLLAAARMVAEDLSVVEGPLHIEFFVSRNELTFVEAGARPAGGGMPQFVRMCGGNDQITMQLLAKLDRERFLRLAAQGPVLETEGMMIDLQGPEASGILTAVPSDEELRMMIPGFVRADWHIKPGARIGQSEDLFDSPGIISVQGTPEQMDAALEAVRVLEAGRLYSVRRPTWRDSIYDVFMGLAP